MRSADMGPRFLSRPVELHWAGWRSTTFDLQQAGWSISAEQDIARMQMQLAFRSPHGDAYGVSSRMNWEYMAERDFSMRSIPMHADLRFGRDVNIYHTGLPSSSFAAIDAMPRMVEERRTRLEDYAHFAPAQIKTNPIVIPQESVPELMERILQLQQPDRTARIQAALRNPEGFDARALPKTMHHAQIISFAQAA